MGIREGLGRAENIERSRVGTKIALVGLVGSIGLKIVLAIDIGLGLVGPIVPVSYTHLRAHETDS